MCCSISMHRSTFHCNCTQPMSPDLLTVAATSPATNLVPAAGLASTSSDSAPATAAGHNHGLSKGAIAGIVIGSLAGAALLMTLAAFVIIKVSAATLLLLCASLLTMTNSAGPPSASMHLLGIRDAASLCSLLACDRVSMRYGCQPLFCQAWLAQSCLILVCRQWDLEDTDACKRHLRPSF
jgi:hypothetical protein